jgi:eukaryotic-like serine/threonine-protein kinase
MADDSRVQELLDRLLDSNATPEEVCSSCPELLPIVRDRWQQLCRLRAHLDALFPPSDDLPPQSAEWEPLPRIPGYEVEAVLGRGGMGVVFRGRHVPLNRPVAIKMMLAGTYAGRRERERFQREAEAVARLRHPNVVQIYDIGDVDGRPYFTMELVDGGSLAQKLAGTPQPALQAAELAVTLAGAVQAAHSCGIVHRDLKPGNVLLTADGTPKISDFGLARRLDDTAGATQTGVAVGTPSYMAPEQAHGRPATVGPAADVYALGAILYELLTGRPPFKGETSAETIHQVIYQEPVPPTLLNPKVPRDLETICLKCLQKAPQRRYSTAAALAEDLSRFQRGEPILARRAGPLERLVKWIRRHRSLAASIVAGMLLVNVLLGVGAWVFFERTAMKQAVNEDFDQVVVAQKEKKWDQARAALERAKGRLGDGGPPELRRRADQLERELALVGRLDTLSMKYLVSESLSGEVARDKAVASYEAEFRTAGLIDGPESAEVVASRIQSTGIIPALLAALDEWAMYDDARQDWLLEVARLADENPASRPLRDSRLWEDEVKLKEFARLAPLSDLSVPFLRFFAVKLAEKQIDPIPFLKRMQESHPTDFRANDMLGFVLLQAKNPLGSIRYFQAAIAIRPNFAAVHYNLGKALSDLGRHEDALDELRIAARLTPDAAICNTGVGHTLANLGRYAEAEQAFRRAFELEPRRADFLTHIGDNVFRQGRHAEAIDLYRQAQTLDPNSPAPPRSLKVAFLELRRPDEGRIAWQQWLAFNPPDHQAWDGYAELCLYLGNEAEYRRTRTELLNRFGKVTDPQVAERTGRACLFLPATDEELKQATALINRALAADQAKFGGLMPYFRFAKALAEYRAGRMKNALELLQGDTMRILPPAPSLLLAMVQHRLGQTDAARKTFDAAVAAYNWDPAKVADREAWMYHVLRREAETVLASKP